MRANRLLPRPPIRLGSWGQWAGWILAGIVLLVGLAATYAAWNHSHALSRAESRYEFEFAANKVVTEITEHLDAHVQTLWGVAALLSSNPRLTREQWSTYVAALMLGRRFPGTRGIGFAVYVPESEREAHVAVMRAGGFGGYNIRPDGIRESYLPVAFIAPFGDRTYDALGFDLMSSPERGTAAKQARDSGSPVLTAKVALLSDQRAQPHAGFILYVPAYRQGVPLETAEQRRAGFIGVASSPFRARDFILTRSIVQQLEHAGLALKIYDGAGTDDDSLLFRTDNFPDLATGGGPPSLVTTIAERVSGRTWTFQFAQLKWPTSDIDQQISHIILGAGILISLLASLVVGTLALNRAQAIEANQRLRMDVARRERAEEKMRQSEAKFRRLFDNIPLPTFAIERETLSYFAVNKAAVERYGYSHEEFATMRITDIRPAEDVPSLVRYMEGVRGQESYTGEFRHRLRNGAVIDVEIMAHSIELDGRHLTVVIAHDISERKQAERALAESEQQLRQAQKLEAVGQLTGGIAHDFNNILTVITGTIEILADGVAHDPKLATIARLIDEAATRGADLTRDLLAFARRQPLQPGDIDVNELVVGASKLFRSTIGESIEVERQLEHDLWRAFVDPSQLTTALLNLALNARDAMPLGGRLLLETANAVLDDSYAGLAKDVRAGAYVMVSVSDNGAGIPSSIRDKVFEPFFTTKEVGRGTGLGLSMVYGFVKQSGGHVQIYSEEGHGTTVRLYLPRANVSSQCATLSPDAQTVEGGRETILVVEDDALVRDYVTEQLNGLGYVTLVAANASEAKAIADKGAFFDLLFTDVIMPGPMNGRQLAEALRACRPGLRVLFTSGYSEQAAIRNSQMDVGVNMLNKPYRKVDLAGKIRRTLDAPADSEDATRVMNAGEER